MRLFREHAVKMSFEKVKHKSIGDNRQPVGAAKETPQQQKTSLKVNVIVDAKGEKKEQKTINTKISIHNTLLMPYKVEKCHQSIGSIFLQERGSPIFFFLSRKPYFL